MKSKLRKNSQSTNHKGSAERIPQWAIVNQQWTILLLLLIAVACSQNKEQTNHDEYTCPMHPTVIQDKPGSCPICGMDLILKGKHGDEVKITSELNYLLQPANSMVIASVKTIMPQQKTMEINTKANGSITYDTRRFTSISIRFAGRIEKLSIKYNFQPIRKGQKILEIYSPELLTAQKDLLYLQNSDKENTQLIEGAKQKLKLLDISDSQIEQLVSTGKEIYSFPVYSPVDGYVVEEKVLTKFTQTSESSANSGMDGGMSGVSSPKVKSESGQASVGELQTREGMYVNTGQVIFKVVNTEVVWAEFDLYQEDVSSIKVNDPLQLTLENSKEIIEANVSFVQPFLQKGERFTKVRVYLNNVGNKFQIGQLVTASFTLLSKGSIWIPTSAKLDLGTTEIAFIKKSGVFQPKAIVTNHQSGDWIEVIEGLAPGDSLAYNAQFMVDSEGFIKVRN